MSSPDTSEVRKDHVSFPHQVVRRLCGRKALRTGRPCPPQAITRSLSSADLALVQPLLTELLKTLKANNALKGKARKAEIKNTVDCTEAGPLRTMCLNLIARHKSTYHRRKRPSGLIHDVRGVIERINPLLGLDEGDNDRDAAEYLSELASILLVVRYLVHDYLAYMERTNSSWADQPDGITFDGLVMLEAIASYYEGLDLE